MKEAVSIVKVRHKKAGKPVGILNPNKGLKNIYHERYLPADNLSIFVEHYWIVKWNIKEPHLSETLPHPSIHIVFEKDNSRIVGVMEGKFSRLIEGKGKVFGIKFKPGAFYPFIKKPISNFTNKFVELKNFFNVDVYAFENSILNTAHDEEMVCIAEEFLLKILPVKDDKVETINSIVEFIKSHKEIIRVEDVADKMKLNKRTLQRLFNQYVGISPKWMIKRYRLHEAAEKLAEDNNADIIKIALDLGYFDQSHFIKDFKAIIGKTPVEYLKMIRF
jgi:AraC-like DNA-binding protein